MIGSKPGEGEPAALDLRYQGSIVRTARECHVSAGVMTMKVGVEGRVVTGPAGGPGSLEVPLRIAVVLEGVNPKPIMSKLVRIPVTITADVDRTTFTHINPDIFFPLPVPLGADRPLRSLCRFRSRCGAAGKEAGERQAGQNEKEKTPAPKPAAAEPCRGGAVLTSRANR